MKEKSSIRVLAVWLAITASMCILPFIVGSFELFVLGLILVNIILATGLNLLTGNAGQVSLCNSTFMAVGAYTCMILNMQVGLAYWIALPIGALFAAFMGFLLGFPALRLNGYYLALATLAFLEIMQIVIQELSGLTNGVKGLLAPKPTLGAYKFTELSFYYVILAFTMIMVFFARNILRTRMGRAFNAIRNSEAASQSLGISLTQVKLTAFTVSAFYAGIAGGLYAPLVGFIDPVEFSLWASISQLTMIIVGGLGSLPGSIVGAVVITVLPELMRILKEYKDFVFGGILLGFLIFMPTGIVGLWSLIKTKTALRRGQKDKMLED